MRVSAILSVIFAASVQLGYQVGILPMLAHKLTPVFFSSIYTENIVMVALPIMAALGSAIVGMLSDSGGRRQWLLLGIVLLTIGGFQSSIAESITELVVGRFLVGAGVGVVGAIAPLYLVELAPKQSRGQWVALYCLAVNVGIFASGFLAGFVTVESSWRFSVLLGSLPGVAIYLFGLLLPESPRWLLFKGQQGKASQLLINLFGSKKAMHMINEMDSVNHRKIYQNVKLLSFQGMRLLLVGLLVNIFSQALGIHALIAYAAVILEKMNFQDQFIQVAANIFIAFVMIIASFFAIHVIDFISRRKLLLIGLGGMIASLATITLISHHPLDSQAQRWGVLLCVIAFVVGQSVSLTPIAGLVSAEVFPQSLRGFGMGICISVGWATNLIIANSFPHMLAEYGASTSLSVFLVFAVIAWIWSYLNVPETVQLSLEQIEAKLHDKPVVTETADNLLEVEVA